MPFENKKPSKENPFLKEMGKFRGEKVTVHFFEGNETRQIEGVLKEIDFAQKTVIIMTNDEKILIPRYTRIHRTRRKDAPQGMMVG